MNHQSIPYKRKALYLLITTPIIIGYILIGIMLYSFNIVYLIIYSALFIIIILLQSYNCICWGCPHVGRLCPGAGGFCMVSSPIAYVLTRLHVKKSRTLYNILCTTASLFVLVLILYPVYFIFTVNALYLFLYFGILIAYAIGMMFLICPFCGAKDVCPGGRFSTRLNAIGKKKKKNQ